VGTALVLLVMVVAMNLSAIIIRNRYRENTSGEIMNGSIQ